MAQNYKLIVCKTPLKNGSTNAIQTYGSGSEGGNLPPEGYAWFPEEFMDEFYMREDPRINKPTKCCGFVNMTFAPGVDSNGENIGDVCTSCVFNWDAYDAYVAQLPDPLPGLKAGKSYEMSGECNRVITEGVDVVLSDVAVAVPEGETSDKTLASSPVVEHFELKAEDQANISSLFNLVLMGGTEYVYHSTGNPCRTYSANEIAKIYIQTQLYISQNVTYNNIMKKYIESLKTEEEVEAVKWGVELTGEFKAEYDQLMQVATEQISAITAKLSATYKTLA